MRILTNFLDAPPHYTLEDGRRAEIVRAESWREFRSLAGCCELIVVDCRDFLIYKLAAYFLLCPWKRRPLAAVDLVLRKPLTVRHKLTAIAKRLLLARIDHFVHYFRDISGYERLFGLPAARSSYVPFKSNLFGAPIPETLAEDYVFAMGVSLRDYDTFIRAMAGLPYPAAIPAYSFLHFEGRTADFPWTPDNLPSNVKILPDSSRREDLITNLSRARVVVIPIVGHSLCASGISTYLDAMYLRKCVVMTEGPGASDLLTNQAILVPPHDVKALQAAIRRAWEDPELRRSVAAAGHRYALSLGGEAALLERIFRQCIRALS